MCKVVISKMETTKKNKREEIEMTDKTGGSAFPASGHPNMQFVAQEGMSLRDYFAAKAMQGYLSTGGFDYYNYPPGCEDECLEREAKMFYRMADAMLKARG